MKKAFLNRHYPTPKSTLGTLVIYDDLSKIWECKTLELPWLGNTRQKSCIVPAVYQVVYAPPVKNFPYPHYRLLNVPGRDGILIHRGNYTSHTLGCILVGLDWGDLNKDGQTDVTNSEKALTRLYEIFGESSWELSIS